MQSAFSKKVRAIVGAIPKGETLSYGEIARPPPHPPRAVGRVMAANFDPAIPCHRVVRADGAPGDYNRGGAERKRAILRAEQT